MAAQLYQLAGILKGHALGTNVPDPLPLRILQLPILLGLDHRFAKRCANHCLRQSALDTQESILSHPKTKEMVHFHHIARHDFVQHGHVYVRCHKEILRLGYKTAIL